MVLKFHRKTTEQRASNTPRPDAPLSVTKMSCEYNMGHKFRGHAIIFKHSEYGYGGGPAARGCADHDANITKEAFEILGFHVTVYSNLRKRQFIDTLKQIAAASDNGDCDALVVVFMSHGFKKGDKEYIHLYDDYIETSALWKDFTPDKCPGLAGKPKLYFIQACRGDDTDKGVKLKAAKKGWVVETGALDMAASAQEDEYVIPLHADFLLMWASYPGMFAFNSSKNGMNGSVFIHFLAKVLKEEHQYDDLATMLLTVTREVAVQYESYCRPGTLNNKKQIPYTVSTLMSHADAQMSVTKMSRGYIRRHKYRGKAIIFKNSAYGNGGLLARGYADHDADITKEAFEILGFHVTVYTNLRKRQFIDTLRQIAAAEDNKDCDALVVVFMSHRYLGRGKERVHLYDGDIETSALWKDFTPDKCPGLARKPKLYFIQTSRGEDTDKGVKLKPASKGLVVETDALAMAASAEEEYVIPLHADFLMMWASYPGMFAFKSPIKGKFAFKSSIKGMNGSVFIHFLAKVLKEDHQNDDLATMLLKVTKEVAVQYKSYNPMDKTLHNKKQIPYTASTLMRKVHFKVK